MAGSSSETRMGGSMRSADKNVTRTEVRSALRVVIALTFVASLHAATPVADADKNWGQWGGPHSTGVSKVANPPVEWSETKNVRWKVEIPGRGSSSPVVWGDRIFLLTAVPEGASIDASHAQLGGSQ